jgi:sigma-B regulation protein RsbU (phosphoserine phosphatase)
VTIDTQLLLVEDNPGDARLMRESLPRTFRITHVERLDKALAALEGQAFDVVLLDLSLPDSHGLETCRRVCQAAPDAPVIVLTGLSDEQVAIQAIHEGAQDWLVKGSADGEVVVRAIRYAIERQRLHARLRELDRLRSLFLSVVTHDLKSPAASILSGIDLLLGEKLGPLTADQRRVLDLARRSAGRQTRLIRDLLDVAVIEAGAMTLHQEQHGARALVSSVLEELAPMVASAGLQARNEVPAELTLRGDPDRLAQALGNLLSNAVKFAASEIRVAARAQPDRLELLVEDDGPGIPPELMDHLFDRFARTEGPRGGAGLGLWIVQGIAEAHQGSVRVENRPEGGARFVLALPLR